MNIQSSGADQSKTTDKKRDKPKFRIWATYLMKVESEGLNGRNHAGNNRGAKVKRANELQRIVATKKKERKMKGRGR
jgi:hypothetical protein